MQAAVYVLMTAMVAWSIQVTVIVDTDWGRMGGIGDVLSSAGQFVGIDWSLFPNLLAPAIEYIIDADYAEYVVETIQMAYLGALFGLLATVPLGWFASYNMTPSGSVSV